MRPHAYSLSLQQFRPANAFTPSSHLFTPACLSVHWAALASGLSSSPSFCQHKAYFWTCCCPSPAMIKSTFISDLCKLSWTLPLSSFWADAGYLPAAHLLHELVASGGFHCCRCLLCSCRRYLLSSCQQSHFANQKFLSSDALCIRHSHRSADFDGEVVLPSHAAVHHHSSVC